MLLRLSKHGSAHPTIGECAPAKNRGNPWSPEGRNPTGREVSTTTNNPSPRFALFAAMSLVLVTAARGPMAAASPLADGATPGEITIIATEFNYAPAKVSVVAGRPITLVLDNSRAVRRSGFAWRHKQARPRGQRPFSISPANMSLPATSRATARRA
jgi:hypothetical protein